MNDLSHFDEQGASRMVDVGQKPITDRTAIASGRVSMLAETLRRVRQAPVDAQNEQAAPMEKGNVLEVARLAGIMASKRTDELIPLCHSLPLSSAKIDFDFPDEQSVVIRATISTSARTGVEMEALTAVTVAALTIYDMCKSVDREIEIGNICLLEKMGGKSGHYRRSVRGASKNS